MNKPGTISEITDFLAKAIDKTLKLTPVSFGKFTSSRLPEDYLYNKWIYKDKDFTDVYLNMDSENQVLFVQYAVGEKSEHGYYLATMLRLFFLFCWNFNTEGVENPFQGKYAAFLTKKATGKTKPNWITAMQILRLFKGLDDNGRKYLTWCCFGAKKKGEGA